MVAQQQGSAPGWCSQQQHQKQQQQQTVGPGSSLPSDIVQPLPCISAAPCIIAPSVTILLHTCLSVTNTESLYTPGSSKHTGMKGRYR